MSLYDDDEFYGEDDELPIITKKSKFSVEETMPAGKWYRLVNIRGVIPEGAKSFYSSAKAAIEDARTLSAKLQQNLILLEAKEEYIPRTEVSVKPFAERDPPKEWLFTGDGKNGASA